MILVTVASGQISALKRTLKVSTAWQHVRNILKLLTPKVCNLARFEHARAEYALAITPRVFYTNAHIKASLDMSGFHTHHVIDASEAKKNYD